MPMKGGGTATDWRPIDQWDGGAGWIAYPDEAMQRASHVLETEAGTYLVDPVDCDGLDDFLADRGPVAGTVVLLNRHKRDAAAIARRHDASVHVPSFMTDVPGDLDAPVERFDERLESTEYRLDTVIDNALWKEALLHGEESKTLVLAEALGTTSYFRTAGERVGVHPALRLTPPRSLRGYDADRLLVGHGEGVFEDVNAAVNDAVDGARKRTPSLYAKNARELLF